MVIVCSLVRSLVVSSGVQRPHPEWEKNTRANSINHGMTGSYIVGNQPPTRLCQKRLSFHFWNSVRSVSSPLRGYPGGFCMRIVINIGVNPGEGCMGVVGCS